MASEQVEFIEDFGNGLNTRDDPNRLPPTFSPTCTNVWYDAKSLKKRNGATIASTVATIFSAVTTAWRGVQIRNYAVGASVVNALAIIADVGQSRRVLVNTTNVSTFFVVARSAPGTIATTSGSSTVTGSSTTFTTLSVGDYLVIGSLGEFLQIQSITNNTTIVATTNAVNTVSGADYAAVPSWGATKRVSFAEMNSLLWLSGQGSPASSYSGTALSSVSAFPQAAYIITHKNYMFAANYGSTPSRIAWSTIKDPTSWPASNFIDVNPDDGFPIVGLFYDGQSIVILKTNTAYKLTGDIFDPSNPTYTLTQIYTPSDFLINSSRTVQLYKNAYIMLGAKGFYSYDGGGTIVKIDDADIIRDQFSAIAGFSISAQPDTAVEPSAIMVDGDYWVSVETTTFSHTTGYKNAVYVIDKNGAIWRWNQNINAQISDFAYRSGTLYAVNADTGGSTGLQTLNTGTVDTGSSAINGTWTSKVFQFPNQQQFLRAHVYYKKQSAGNLTFEYSVDEGAFTSVTVDMTAGTGTRVKSSQIIMGQFGSTIQFRLSNATASQTFEVYGIEYIRRDLKV